MLPLVLSLLLWPLLLLPTSPLLTSGDHGEREEGNHHYVFVMSFDLILRLPVDYYHHQDGDEEATGCIVDVGGYHYDHHYP